MHIKVKGRKYPKHVVPGWLPHPMHTLWHKNANVKALLPYLTRQSWPDTMPMNVLKRGRYRSMVFPPRPIDGLAAFTSLGSYPLLYLTRDNQVLCADCAFEQTTKRGLDWPRIVDVQPFYEGSPYQCANCNKDIESAYGDPDAEENEDA